MTRSMRLLLCGIAWACLPFAMGAEGTSSPYTDAIGDIDPGISTASGTLDITGMEVSNTSTDINFKLTVNGDVALTDWGKFMVESPRERPTAHSRAMAGAARSISPTTMIRLPCRSSA